MVHNFNDGAKKSQPAISQPLKIHGIEFNEIIPNLGELIKSQEKNLIQDRNGTERSVTFDSYYSHSEVSYVHIF